MRVFGIGVTLLATTLVSSFELKIPNLPIPVITPSTNNNNNVHHNDRTTAAAAAATPQSPFQQAMQDSYNVATLLLGTVLERRAQDVDDSFEARIARWTPSYQRARQQQQARKIESLVERLRYTFYNSYDPFECLVGGAFYCTLYYYTPGGVGGDDDEHGAKAAAPPLWEQVSLLDTNAKGQQYFLTRDFVPRLHNYAEVLGKAVYIKAYGELSPIADARPQPSSQNPLLAALLETTNPRPEPLPETHRACPDVYEFTAQGAEIGMLGVKIPIPIQGTSEVVVVLYADPRIRILLSPMCESTSAVVGSWENEGLVVVQVRSDLVPGDTPEDIR